MCCRAIFVFGKRSFWTVKFNTELWIKESENISKPIQPFKFHNSLIHHCHYLKKLTKLETIIEKWPCTLKRFFELLRAKSKLVCKCCKVECYKFFFCVRNSILDNSKWIFNISFWLVVIWLKRAEIQLDKAEVVNFLSVEIVSFMKIARKVNWHILLSQG